MRLSLLLILLPLLGYSQVRCGLDSTYFKSREESTATFEKWMSGEVKQMKNLEGKYLETFNKGVEKIYRIPVVFHIIHNGEPIGTGTNIPDEKIIEQLTILNEDFRRQNADSILTPLIFADVIGDTRVEFLFARQDPEGRPTTGIVRKKGSKETYSWRGYATQDDFRLKAESRWPPDQYLNIYVADLTYNNSGNLLGYATFPFTNLEGINDNIYNINELDGVALDFQYVGINEATGGSFASYGRTLTHEIGHYLGLRHVWGDGGCSADDFCEDTPIQSVTYNGLCPSSNQKSCDSFDMYGNYLNYTADACMNAFSLDQRDRMHIVLENSPNRKSLLTSKALEFPAIYTRDLGVRKILSPTISNCSNTFIPTVEVRNYGRDTIQQFNVSLYINDVLIESVERLAEIAPNELDVVNFREISIVETQRNTISYTINTVDGQLDENTSNNSTYQELIAFDQSILPYELDFESEERFELRYTEGESLWDVVRAPKRTVENSALSLSFYKDSSRYGQYEYLLSPVFDLSGLNSAELSFKYAYSGIEGINAKDGLIVAVSTDCGQTYRRGDYIFERYGNALKTTTEKDTLYVPGGPIEWQTVNLNLTRFTGYSDVRIAFIGQHGNGNLIYVDDIIISSNSLKAYDLSIRNIKNLPVITCDEFVIPTIEMKNLGYESVKSFNASYTIQNDRERLFFNDYNILSGESENIGLTISDLENGAYTINFKVDNPNGFVDQFAENNSITYRMVVSDATESLPLRQKMYNLEGWTITSPLGDELWAPTRLGDNSALKANGYASKELGTEHYFISPVLNTDGVDSASLSFKYAYAKRSTYNDRLKVLLSTNCGRDFQYVLFEKNAEDLSELISNEPFVPTSDSIWITETINLSDYVIWPELRVAFVFENGNGNNLFLDDIEFFNEARPPEVVIDDPVSVFPNPVINDMNILFNLEVKEDVEYQLVDLSGKTILSGTFKNALNQQIRFDSPNYGGFYILRIFGETFSYSEKLLIRR